MISKLTYQFFKFLEDKKGRKMPFKVKLIYAPETLTREDLNVEGDLNLSDTKITSLPNNLKVGGSLFLRNTPITSLPNNLQVEKYLDLHGTPITSLPDNFKVKGSLLLSNTPITSLPNNLQVGGYLDLRHAKITSLPNNLQVGGYLGLRDTPITSLPDNLKVGGSLELSNTKITSLPDNLQVGGDLDLSNTKITSLSDNLKIGEDLFLRGTPITSLPDNLKVGGDLDLRGTLIKNLPSNLGVRRDLLIRDTSIDTIPEDARIGRSIIMELPADLSIIPEKFKSQILIAYNLSFKEFENYRKEEKEYIIQKGKSKKKIKGIRGKIEDLEKDKTLSGYQSLQERLPKFLKQLSLKLKINWEYYIKSISLNKNRISSFLSNSKQVLIVKGVQGTSKNVLLIAEYKNKLIDKITLETDKGKVSATTLVINKELSPVIIKNLSTKLFSDDISKKVPSIDSYIYNSSKPDISWRIGNLVRTGKEYDYSEVISSFSRQAQQNIYNSEVKEKATWDKVLVFRNNGAINYIIHGVTKEGEHLYYDRRGFGVGTKTVLLSGKTYKRTVNSF